MSAAPRRRARNIRGAALVEAAIGLPLFLLLTFGLIDLTGALREQLFVLEALARAQRAAAALSAVETLPGTGYGEVAQNDLLLKAGEEFMAALKEKGIAQDALEIGKDSAQQPYVLLGVNYIFNETYPVQAYELRAVHTPTCFFCRFTGGGLHLHMATVAVLETAKKYTYVPPNSSPKVYGFFPGYSGDARVKELGK